MVTIEWTNKAENWLKEIHEYIAIDNPTAAKNVVNGIYDKAQNIEEFS